MSRVVSMRLPNDQFARLDRYARALGKSSGETSALLVEEHLREAEFALIEFRPSPVGRQAYLKGSRLTVWWVIHTARSYFDMDAEKTAAHLDRPVAFVRAALNYHAAYRAEIEQAIEDNRVSGFDALRRALPGAERIDVPANSVG